MGSDLPSEGTRRDVHMRHREQSTADGRLVARYRVIRLLLLQLLQYRRLIVAGAAVAAVGLKLFVIHDSLRRVEGLDASGVRHVIQ